MLLHLSESYKTLSFMKKLIAFIFFLAFFSINAQEIPNLTLKNIEGEYIVLKDLVKDDSSLKVFSFWATWCVPCINELDSINEVYGTWQEETNVEIIAVSIDDSRTSKRIRPLVNGKGWKYQILLDSNQDFKRALNISTVPYLIVVKNGEIVFRHSGYNPGDEEQLLEVIKKHS